MDCLFCKIIKGEIPCYKIFENDYVLAFLDINPDSNGHTLIVPKRHFIDLDDIELEYLNEIYKSAKIVKKLLEEKLNCDGMSLLQNNGIVQEVKHFHLHLKPQYKDKNSLEIIKHNEYIDKVEDIYKLFN